MSEVYLWHLKSAGDNTFYNIWTESDSEPTVINFNGTHAVVPGSGRVVRTLREDAPRLDNEDGRIMVAPVIHPDYMNPYFTSEGDDYAGGVRGDGTPAAVELTYDGTTTEHTMNVQFVDHVHMIGGKIWVSNGNIKDRICVSIEAPGTPAAANGSTTGNCHRVDLSGGFNMAHLLIPAAFNGTTGTGTHDVPLTTPMNANLAGPDPVFVSQCVPIPAYGNDGLTPEGFWDWDELTGAITPCPAQDGIYNLYDFPIVLTRYVHNLCVSTGIPNSTYHQDMTLHHRSGPMLPQWYMKCVFTTADTHNIGDKVIYNVGFVIARRKSS